MFVWFLDLNPSISLEQITMTIRTNGKKIFATPRLCSNLGSDKESRPKTMRAFHYKETGSLSGHGVVVVSKECLRNHLCNTCGIVVNQDLRRV